jgi:phage protein D
VAAIAKRNGFDQGFAIIEPTDDHIEELVLEEGQSDGAYLANLAQEWNRVFKLDGEVLRWHTPTWSGAKLQVADHLHYGHGEDILKLAIDCDFRLPVPGRIKGVGFDYKRRALQISDNARTVAENKANLSIGYLDRVIQDPARYNALTRSEVIPISADNVLMADKRTIKAFIKRHYRAFQLVVTTVGNPRLLAGRLLDIDGVGSPFADGRWLIDEAMHTVTEETYETEVKLKPPPKHTLTTGAVVALQVRQKERDLESPGKTVSAGYLRRMTEAQLKSLRKPSQ